MSSSAWADGIVIEDAYARSNGPMAKAGAAFLVIRNDGAVDDTLVGVSSDVARMVELHTHVFENDVARMVALEDGITIAAGEAHRLERGGDHVMFMGLEAPFKQGESVPVVFVFEKAGEIAVEIEVDLERKPDGDHSNH